MIVLSLTVITDCVHACLVLTLAAALMCVCVYIYTYNTTNVCNGTSLYAFLISVVCMHDLSTVTVTFFFAETKCNNVLSHSTNGHSGRFDCSGVCFNR